MLHARRAAGLGGIFDPLPIVAERRPHSKGIGRIAFNPAASGAGIIVGCGFGAVRAVHEGFGLLHGGGIVVFAGGRDLGVLVAPCVAPAAFLMLHARRGAGLRDVFDPLPVVVAAALRFFTDELAAFAHLDRKRRGGTGGGLLIDGFGIVVRMAFKHRYGNMGIGDTIERGNRSGCIQRKRRFEIERLGVHRGDRGRNIDLREVLGRPVEGFYHDLGELRRQIDIGEGVRELDHVLRQRSHRSFGKIQILQIPQIGKRIDRQRAHGRGHFEIDAGFRRRIMHQLPHVFRIENAVHRRVILVVGRYHVALQRGAVIIDEEIRYGFHAGGDHDLFHFGTGARVLYDDRVIEARSALVHNHAHNVVASVINRLAVRIAHLRDVCGEMHFLKAAAVAEHGSAEGAQRGGVRNVFQCVEIAETPRAQMRDALAHKQIHGFGRMRPPRLLGVLSGEIGRGAGAHEGDRAVVILPDKAFRDLPVAVGMDGPVRHRGFAAHGTGLLGVAGGFARGGHHGGHVLVRFKGRQHFLPAVDAFEFGFAGGFGVYGAVRGIAVRRYRDVAVDSRTGEGRALIGEHPRISVGVGQFHNAVHTGDHGKLVMPGAREGHGVGRAARIPREGRNAGVVYAEHVRILPYAALQHETLAGIAYKGHGLVDGNV